MGRIIFSFLSSKIHGRRGPFVSETELADFGRDAGGYACFDGPAVQPALVQRVVVERFWRGWTLHVVVEGELLHEARVGLCKGAGLPYEVEGGVGGEGGVVGEEVGD